MAVEQAVKTIVDLPHIIDSFSDSSRRIFNSIFVTVAEEGELDPRCLDPQKIACKQIIVRVFNQWDHSQAKFNSERAKRPQMYKPLDSLIAIIESERGKDAFCNYLTTTPKDPFGDIKGNSCVMVSNLFKSACFHGVQIFDEHNPLVVPTEDQFLDRFETADHWFQTAFKYNSKAIYPSYFQNQLAKAAASIWFHGHSQTGLETNFHEGEMERLFSTASFYHHLQDRNYFQDLFNAHQVVGLGVEKDGLMVFPSLTPVKEQQVVMLAKNFNTRTQSLVYKIYRHYAENLGVKSFNFAVGYPPLGPDGRDWRDFPTVISLVDRGDPMISNSDMGGAEVLLKSSIIAADPFKINEGLVKALNT